MDSREWARAQAERLLAPLGARWAHTQAVAEQADRLRTLFSERDGDHLVAAALLHDIGYAPDLILTGFHPLDGAVWLSDLVDSEVIALVAHHSCAHVEADLRGLSVDLAELPTPNTRVLDALTYCDMTSGPDGKRVTVEQRLAEVRLRYGPEHVVTRTIDLAAHQLREAATRVHTQVTSAGLLADQPR